MLGIQLSNNVNFNGGFKVNYKRAVKGTKEIIEQKYIGARRFIIRDFNPENPDEVIYILRDANDLGLAKALQRNEVPMTYYPNLNTGGHYDSFAQVQKAVNSTDKVIKGASRAIKFIEDTERVCASVPKQKVDLRGNILARLNLFFTPTKPACKKGMFVCNNATGEKGQVIMSQLDKNGNIFIRVEEHEPNAIPKYYKFNGKTNEIQQYKGADGILQFKKDFNAAQEFYKSKNR